MATNGLNTVRTLKLEGLWHDARVTTGHVTDA